MVLWGGYNGYNITGHRIQLFGRVIILYSENIILVIIIVIIFIIVLITHAGFWHHLVNKDMTAYRL